MNLKHLTGTPQPQVPTDRAASARADAAASRASPLPAASATLAPAASVRVSNVAAGSLAAAASMTDQNPSDAELLAALKARIEAGEFQIDYSKLARSLVEDALQSIGRQR
jgi:flagellar biosynthesis anti-sigma factor FlgM